MAGPNSNPSPPGQARRPFVCRNSRFARPFRVKDGGSRWLLHVLLELSVALARPFGAFP